MKKKLLILLFISTVYTLIGQEIPISINIYKDENLLKKMIKGNIILDNDTIYLKNVSDSVLLIPNNLQTKKVNLYLYIDSIQLNFYSLYLDWNKDLPKWNVFIDFPPHERDWRVPKKYKKKWLYSIDRGNGTIITYYNKYNFNSKKYKSS